MVDHSDDEVAMDAQGGRCNLWAEMGCTTVGLVQYMVGPSRQEGWHNLWAGMDCTTVEMVQYMAGPSINHHSLQPDRTDIAFGTWKFVTFLDTLLDMFPDMLLDIGRRSCRCTFLGMAHVCQIFRCVTLRHVLNRSI